MAMTVEELIKDILSRHLPFDSDLLLTAIVAIPLGTYLLLGMATDGDFKLKSKL